MSRITAPLLLIAIAILFHPAVRAAEPNAPRVRPPLQLSEADRRDIAEALQSQHARYDPAERMIRRPFSSPGYHTTLSGGDVHPTRDALAYAVALLDTGRGEHLQRAQDILRRVISLQDQDPNSRTYGIWSWFLEEPLDKMSPPDWNWADFCGQALLQVVLDHRQRLAPDLAAQVDASIQHAARSIQRRNVGPGYTNIAILGTYVTSLAAELYQLPDLRQYAADRLRRFHEYTRRNGGFSEYNSPTYTLVSLKALAQLRNDFRDPVAAPLLDDLHRAAWEEIAQHFHASTRQWAGPHSRAYRTLLDTGTLHLIERATEGRVDFGIPHRKPGPEDFRTPLHCPADLEPFFTPLEAPRMLRKTFARSEPPVIGATWLHPDFALSSINRGDFWNQRRAILAYWGTPQAPAYLHVRVLHDDYDFSAAQVFCVQHENAVLAGINFATDGGDRHVSLDRIKNGTFRARDLRLRFEFGGSAAVALQSRPSLPARATDPLTLTFDKLAIHLAVPFAQLGEPAGRWESSAAGNTAQVDLVLYAGPEKSFNLNGLSPAAIALALQITPAGQPAAPCAAELDSARLSARLPLARGALVLSIPVKPAPTATLHRAAASSAFP